MPAPQKLQVLFIVAQPNITPTVSVHANVMRFLSRDRVEVHVIYPRIAAEEPWRSSGNSVLEALPAAPAVDLRPVALGARAGAGKPEMLGSALTALRDALSLVRFIRRRQIDVIHCDYGVLSGFYGYLLSRMTHTRYLIHLHSTYGSWLKRPSVFAIAQADAVVPVSEWVGRTAVQRGGVSPQRIFPILNGIDVSKWDPTLSGHRVRQELEMAPEAPLVVQIAQLTHWKRQDLVIDAFRAVVADHPSARLLLVGSEEDPALGYGEQLRRQVADAGLEGHVIFAGRRRDIDRVLAAADIFVLPSTGEPFGLVFAEAMAMATPIISVRSGGIPEVVEHGKAGLLGSPDDPAQLASNLLALIDDPARRTAMGAYGRRRVLQYFNAQRMADEMEAIYRCMCRADWRAVPQERSLAPVSLAA